MAEGGASTFNSLRKSSDEVIDFPCSSCSRNVESEKFCQECGEYLCTACLEQHRRFTRATPHQLVDKDSLKSLGLVEKCPYHQGKPISHYCSDHDQLCCGECIAENHGSCTNIKYVSDVAKGTSKCQELTGLSESLKVFMAELTALRKMRQDDYRSLQTQLQDAITKIACEKQKVITRLDELEEATVKQLRAKHGGLEHDIDEGIRVLQTILTELNNMYDKLDTSVHANDNGLFISMKTGQKTLESAKRQLVDIDGYLQKKSLIFDTDSSLETFISSLQSFGEIRDRFDYRVHTVDEYNIKTKEDTVTCTVIGICDLKDGSVLVADWDNKCLKKLDSSYSVSQRYALPCHPYGASSSDVKEAVVTLTNLKQILFVSVDNTMTLGRRIDVGEYCRGIACHVDRLYVACGGGSLQREGPGQVKIYMKTGELLSVVQHDGNKQTIFGLPRKLVVNNQGTRIYVTDEHKGIIILDRHGYRVSSFTDKRVESADGVCTVDQGNLFVSCKKSNSVLYFQTDGTASIKQITKCATSIRCLCLDKSNSSLVIGGQSNCITVVSLVKK